MSTRRGDRDLRADAEGGLAVGEVLRFLLQLFLHGGVAADSANVVAETHRLILIDFVEMRVSGKTLNRDPTTMFLSGPGVRRS